MADRLYQPPTLDPAELEVMGRIDEVRRNFGHATRMPTRWYGSLRRSSLARNVRGSNSIEGHRVSVEDAMAAGVGEEPVEASAEDRLALIGYRNAMTYVLQLARDPHFTYSTDLVRSLHFMMVGYDLAKSPGIWRSKPINIVDSLTGDVAYEAPDAEAVPELAGALVDSLRREGYRDGPLPELIQAATAHLNLVLIHPFSDGNGRMARCLHTLVLARAGMVDAEFSSIEEYLGHERNTQDYYKVLAEVGGGRWQPQRSTRPWIRFCLTAHFRQATTYLERVKMMHKLWDAMEAEVKKRKLPERMVFALADAALGFKVRNPLYRFNAEVTMGLASKDLNALVREGLLVPRGERRGRHYEASPELLRVRRSIPAPPRVRDPFEELQGKPR